MKSYFHSDAAIRKSDCSQQPDILSSNSAAKWIPQRRRRLDHVHVSHCSTEMMHPLELLRIDDTEAKDGLNCLEDYISSDLKLMRATL